MAKYNEYFGVQINILQAVGARYPPGGGGGQGVPWRELQDPAHPGPAAPV